MQKFLHKVFWILFCVNWNVWGYSGWSGRFKEWIKQYFSWKFWRLSRHRKYFLWFYPWFWGRNLQVRLGNLVEHFLHHGTLDEKVISSVLMQYIPKFFSIQHLNERIEGFQYEKKELRSKPQQLTEKKLEKFFPRLVSLGNLLFFESIASVDRGLNTDRWSLLGINIASQTFDGTPLLSISLQKCPHISQKCYFWVLAAVANLVPTFNETKASQPCSLPECFAVGESPAKNINNPFRKKASK